MCAWTVASPGLWRVMPRSSCVAMSHHIALSLSMAASQCGFVVDTSLPMHTFSSLASLTIPSWKYSSRLVVSVTDESPDGSVKSPETQLDIDVFVPVRVCVGVFVAHELLACL